MNDHLNPGINNVYYSKARYVSIYIYPAIYQFTYHLNALHLELVEEQ